MMKLGVQTFFFNRYFIGREHLSHAVDSDNNTTSHGFIVIAETQHYKSMCVL